MKIGNKSIFIILLLGLLVRIIFYFFGGEIYFGKTDFQVGGDSAWWFINIKNLVDYGIYTDNINNPLGYFTRTPGYSFFLGIFYLLLSKDQILTFKYAVIAQIILDVLSILFMYLISLSIFNNYKNALITALIYALYPFIIVWNVVAYAESLSVFLFLAAIYTFIGFKKERYFALKIGRAHV
jgi:Gpi18-like mannosyltransferase